MPAGAPSRASRAVINEMIKDPPRDPEETVAANDLRQLDGLKTILRILNDEHAGATQIAPYVERFPPFKARIAHRFRVRHPARKVPSVAEQIALLGNGEFERLLLELLEDLTILRGDLEAAAERARAQGRVTK